MLVPEVASKRSAIALSAHALPPRTKWVGQTTGPGGEHVSGMIVGALLGGAAVWFWRDQIASMFREQ